MRVINHNKNPDKFLAGELVVQFFENTDKAAAQALIESNGCIVKALSWSDKMHIGYITCPVGDEVLKSTQLKPHVKWVERMRAHDFHMDKKA